MSEQDRDVQRDEVGVLWYTATAVERIVAARTAHFRALLAKWEREDDERPGWFMREFKVGMNRTGELRAAIKHEGEA